MPWANFLYGSVNKNLILPIVPDCFVVHCLLICLFVCLLVCALLFLIMQNIIKDQYIDMHHIASLCNTEQKKEVQTLILWRNVFEQILM